MGCGELLEMVRNGTRESTWILKLFMIPLWLEKKKRALDGKECVLCRHQEKGRKNREFRGTST